MMGAGRARSALWRARTDCAFLSALRSHVKSGRVTRAIVHGSPVPSPRPGSLAVPLPLPPIHHCPWIITLHAPHHPSCCCYQTSYTPRHRLPAYRRAPLFSSEYRDAGRHLYRFFYPSRHRQPHHRYLLFPFSSPVSSITRSLLVAASPLSQVNQLASCSHPCQTRQAWAAAWSGASRSWRCSRSSRWRSGPAPSSATSSRRRPRRPGLQLPPGARASSSPVRRTPRRRRALLWPP